MLPPPLQSCTYKAPTAAPRLHHRCPSAAAAGADCGAEARPDLTSHCARSEVKFSPFVAAAPGLISHPDEPGRPPSPSMSPRPRAPATSVSRPQQPTAATSSIHSIRRPSCSNRSTRARFARPLCSIRSIGRSSCSNHSTRPRAALHALRGHERLARAGWAASAGYSPEHEVS
jgi:hypothetical protein